MSSREASDKYPTGSTAKPYTDFDGNIVTLMQLVRLEPVWARSRIIVGEEALLRITELENTNRLLCRDLDEAQRSIEVLRGESIE